jgi:hypothetical protein
MTDSKKEVLKILEKNKITNFYTPEDQIKLALEKSKLESTSHPAIGRKEPKTMTLEQEKEEWDFCMDQADYDTMLRREMAKIREEGIIKENSVTDTHKVIYEAEKRVKKYGKKDIYKYDKKEK